MQTRTGRRPGEAWRDLERHAIKAGELVIVRPELTGAPSNMDFIQCHPSNKPSSIQSLHSDPSRPSMPEMVLGISCVLMWRIRRTTIKALSSFCLITETMVPTVDFRIYWPPQLLGLTGTRGRMMASELRRKPADMPNSTMSILNI